MPDMTMDNRNRHMNPSTNSEIPLVDLASSQEDESPTRAVQKRKEPSVLQFGDTKKTRTDETTSNSPDVVTVSKISRGDFETLDKRVKALENVVTHESNSPLKKERYATREEFDDLARRVLTLEERVGRLENGLSNIKSAFLNVNFTTGVTEPVNSPIVTPPNPAPFNGLGSQGEQTKRGMVPKSVIPRRTPSKILKKKAQDLHSRPNTVVPSVSTLRPDDTTPETSSSNTPRSTNAGSAVIIPPKKSSTLLSNQINPIPSTSTSTASHLQGVTIRPILEQSPVTSKVPYRPSVHSQKKPITPQQPLQARFPNRLNSYPSHVRPIPLATKSPLIKATNKQMWETSSTLTAQVHQIITSEYSMDEISEAQLTSIPIKKELYDNTQGHIAFPSAIHSLRRDSENRFLTYLHSEARKVRNKEQYIAGFGWDIGENRFSTLRYHSDVVTKYLKNQAEILAAFFAVEAIKFHSSGTGPVKATIVTHCAKLIQAMNYLQHIYPCKDVCVCELPDFPCGHSGRWETKDPFAALYPDDLPRLVLQAKFIDITWRLYGHNELQMEEAMKKQLKESVI